MEVWSCFLKLMIMKNWIMKIQDLVVNYKSWPVKLNPADFLQKYLMKSTTGVEMRIGHQIWPKVFATWLVINFQISNLVQSFCEKNWKLCSSFWGFKVIYQWSRNNKPKDVYLPLSVTNNVCSVLGRSPFFLYVVIPGNHNMFNFQS